MSSTQARFCDQCGHQLRMEAVPLSSKKAGSDVALLVAALLILATNIIEKISVIYMYTQLDLTLYYTIITVVIPFLFLFAASKRGPFIAILVLAVLNVLFNVLAIMYLNWIGNTF
ncbi:hypothetical protein QLX67_04695 [Balneolaceae bacterium ANBcel3]|nr:hypothetical protein [Balneolaceae bacterium ANBcel3]